ncbi:MAG TPA: ADYC domain-containing protein [Haliangium sp.]|nr:ADYC domain-containing protein [Haliangium sp.]
MRHTAPFTSTGPSVSSRRSSSRRWRILSASATLFAVLVTPGDCEPARLEASEEDPYETERRRLQGPSLQATLLPDESGAWLQGERLHASLADGRRIEITGFAGDVVHARALSRDGVREHGAPLRLHPAELVGMQWTETRCEGDTCTGSRFRIASAAPDDTENTMPRHSSNRDSWLYRVERTALPAPGAPGAPAAPDTHAWQDACADEPGGSGMGLFVDGRWGSDGAWYPGGYTFSCARGVIAKCARSWGYKPWKTLTTDHGRVSLHPLHLACTRAARADYCGDGTPHTREGVLIGMSNGHGLNPRAPRGSVIEAIFDHLGALRVHDWRIPALAPACRPARPASNALDVIEVWR